MTINAEYIREEYMSVKQGIDITGCARNTICRWAANGDIRSITVRGGKGRHGYNYWINKEDLLAKAASFTLPVNRRKWRAALRYKKIRKLSLYASIAEVAEKLGCCEQTVKRMIYSGKIEAVRIRKCNAWRIRRSTLKD